ncbi:hypothetical protein [Dyella japonica]|uniref:DUF4239 domain-containing protein n=1 Tax=Dyella japonica TaxID=231455 RepID=A0ABV2K1C5_9GAMM
MEFELSATLSMVGLFGGMLLSAEIGRRIGSARIARHPEGLSKGIDAAEAAVFGLLGLLIAFTFSGASSRFDDRRHLISAEVNAVDTAYMRIDLLPTDTQPQMRGLFRRYLETRLVVYRDVDDKGATTARLDETAALQREIWRQALAACHRADADPHAALLLLPALNALIDITATRTMATRAHPPLAIYLMLAGLCVLAALLVGYDTSLNSDRSWLHTVVFTATLSLTVYVIVDIEFPRQGLIRVNAADQAFSDLRARMQSRP